MAKRTRHQEPKALCLLRSLLFPANALKLDTESGVARHVDASVSLFHVVQLALSYVS